ncbi:MAG TPA: glutathione S-transferase N-terminal domain-containing protein [Steroidobacteraceae bacterium]|nr:glutathione S-transferase N-terminal domain-containing protein [Steroidobacteraceae bacterium]HRX90525.1 glutathione S-transferase N-terminal domain-containing protein [Steroidobacteraceae bacterium]
MIDLYYWPTPNGHKIPIMLEEAKLEYRVKPINMLRGEQFRPAFLKISPNNKIPAIVDQDGPGGEPLALFESGAILQYLAEKAGKFMPRDRRRRYTVIQWLTFQTANVGPMFGQCGHFLGYAPRKIAYAIERYRNETLRLYGVMDRRLAHAEFLADDYSIADMATWPWVHVRWLHKIDLDEFPHVRRWYDTLAARPAVQRGIALLADRMKIGNPDKQARAALFGRQQLSRGKPAKRAARR